RRLQEQFLKENCCGKLIPVFNAPGVVSFLIDNLKIYCMEENTKGPEGTKATLFDKAGEIFENVKEKAEELLNKAKESEFGEKAIEKFGDLKESAKDLVHKAKESELGGKAIEKLDDLKEGAKNVVSKVVDKVSGKPKK
ncbi:MAG TPA: hypothetical protein VFT15_05835, partial [Chitinophagaceae bacterium]|nr:hypothetical protein [Chitinophagaceae bacterium]